MKSFIFIGKKILFSGFCRSKYSRVKLVRQINVISFYKTLFIAIAYRSVVIGGNLRMTNSERSHDTVKS